MKRILIFGLLGPFLSLMVLCAPTAIKSFSALPHVFLTMLPFAYTFGLGLMAIAGVADWLLAGRKWLRIAASAAAAYVAVIVFQYMTGPLVMLSLGLVGAIPAAVCSWLSSNQQGGAQSPVPTA